MLSLHAIMYLNFLLYVIYNTCVPEYTLGKLVGSFSDCLLHLPPSHAPRMLLSNGDAHALWRSDPMIPTSLTRLAPSSVPLFCAPVAPGSRVWVHPLFTLPPTITVQESAITRDLMRDPTGLRLFVVCRHTTDVP